MADHNIHVFWSGSQQAQLEARMFASENDCIILEMTHVARYKQDLLAKERRRLEKQGWRSREIWFQKELPVWEKLSREFAESSPHKEVHVFIDISYKNPEEMVKQGENFKEKPWLNDFYYGWAPEDFQKFRNCFPDGEIPKLMKECRYDRKKSVLHRVEHPILKKMNKKLIIHYVNR